MKLLWIIGEMFFLFYLKFKINVVFLPHDENVGCSLSIGKIKNCSVIY